MEQSDGRLSKRTQDSETEQVQLVFDAHLNSEGHLFGGQLVAWIDVVAGITARRHCGRSVTTAVIDSLQFRRPVSAGSMVVLRGRVTWVGRTSMEVRVDSYVESAGGTRELVNTAYLVLVALGADGRPAEVPGLTCVTEAEKAERNAAEKRRLLRIARRTEGY